MIRALACATSLGMLIACSEVDSADAPADAGTQSADGSGLADAMPASDAMLSPDAGTAALQLPTLTPCADGWREVDVEGFTVCDPWPETGRELCDGARVHLPGTDGCQPLGPACPASGWATDLPVGADILYVDVAAPNGAQDGTLEAPFRTLSQALNQAGPGQILALAVGDYQEDITISNDVTLWGACAEQTRIVASTVPETDRDRDTLVSVQTPAASMHNLSIVGGFPAFELTASAGLELHSTLVTGAVIGVELLGQNSLSTQMVRFSQPRRVIPSDPSCGDPTVRCRTLFGEHISGRSVSDMAVSVRLESTELGGTGPVRIDELETESSSTLVLDRVVADYPVTLSRGQTRVTASKLVLVRGAVLELRDSIVIDTHAFVQANIGRVSARDVRLLHDDAQAAHVVEDLVLRAGLPGDVSTVNRTGIDLVADAELRRVAILSSEGVGLRVESDAQVHAEDLHFLRALEDSSVLPTSLGVYDQARMTLDRFAILGSDLLGIQLMDSADLVLFNGSVEECAIGANVQIDGYNLSKLQNNVSWYNNQVDIDAQELAPPPSLPEWQCGDGIDNDGNLQTDCEDSACAGFVGCAL